MVKVAEVTVHAMYFRVPFFLYHHQVMELEAILVVGTADQEFQEVVNLVVQKEHQDHQRRLIKVDGDGKLVSSSPSFSDVISWS